MRKARRVITDWRLWLSFLLGILVAVAAINFPLQGMLLLQQPQSQYFSTSWVPSGMGGFSSAGKDITLWVEVTVSNPAGLSVANPANMTFTVLIPPDTPLGMNIRHGVFAPFFSYRYRGSYTNYATTQTPPSIDLKPPHGYSPTTLQGSANLIYFSSGTFSGFLIFSYETNKSSVVDTETPPNFIQVSPALATEQIVNDQTLFSLELAIVILIIFEIGFSYYLHKKTQEIQKQEKHLDFSEWQDNC